MNADIPNRDMCYVALVCALPVLPQTSLFSEDVLEQLWTPERKIQPFKTQLLKWVGNKQRFAHEIIGFFPQDYGTYFEPFIGSGAVLGTLAPKHGVAGDVLEPLVQIWQTLSNDPDQLVEWYAERWRLYHAHGGKDGYEIIKATYNRHPNGADLLFLSRSCYGGVVRFRKDGYMSTPCGVHAPISPAAFRERVRLWAERVHGTTFIHADALETMGRAVAGDLVYCDPPYVDSQTILYGAQNFDLEKLFEAISDCKARGVKVALSIDGTKRSGNKICDVPIPTGVFEREAMVNCGRSMLRRFQMAGETLESEVVNDRLLLTW
jgi:DNA adenine methylase